MAESPTTSVPGCPNCIRLEREVHELREEVAELRRQLNRNSGNSSMPPSANPPWAPRPVKKKPSGRRPGGQPGHKGFFRKLLPVDQADHVIPHKPAACKHCAAAFGENTRWEVRERYQVTELPKRAVEVTEHQALAGQCVKCGHVTEGKIPEELTRSVLGERLSAAVALFSSRVHGSRRAVEEVLEDILGAPISLGTVSNREREVAQALAEPYRQAKVLVQKAPAKNVDETGWRRAGRCLWVAATRRLAVFHLDPCRNRDAMRMLLGRKTRGTICTDRYGVYDEVPLEQRAICWAHLKRDFQQVEERGGASTAIGRAGLRLCKAVCALWHQFCSRQIGRKSLRRGIRPLRAKMRKLLKRGVRMRVKGTSGFCQDVLGLEPALWTFATTPGIEPTNNHAERMLRPAVMWRKQSQGSHSLRGCRFVERILTVVQTLKLAGRSAMDYLERAVHALRSGQAPPPLLC
jgi:transposase